MQQPIAGVAPATLNEVTVMTVWPSIAATGLGRFLGRLYAINVGFSLFGVRLTVGKLLALASIPLVLPMIFAALAIELLVAPVAWILRVLGATRLSGRLQDASRRRYRYVLTNQRVLVQRGLKSVTERWVSLDRFDSIEVQVLPGQAWYPAGELIFRLGAIETFHLAGVPHPEAFRQTCLKAHQSFVGVQKARQRGAAV